MIKNAGVTLLEVLLVIAVASVSVMVVFRFYREKADDILVEESVSRIQRIMDAATTFYIVNGRWPDAANFTGATSVTGASQSELIPDYMPSIKSLSLISTNSSYDLMLASYLSSSYKLPTNSYAIFNNDFWVPSAASEASKVRADGLVRKVMTKLPQSTITGLSTSTERGRVIVYAMPPPTSALINNQEGFNYAGLYHQGGCIPVPQCPPVKIQGTTTNTTAQVMLVPISVSGVNDDGSTNVYPISSFTAYVTGPSAAAGNPNACTAASSVSPDCSNAANVTTANRTTTNQFWRACIQVITSRGDVQQTRTDNWGSDVSMAAFTRCAPNNDSLGKDITTTGSFGN